MPINLDATEPKSTPIVYVPAEACEICFNASIVRYKIYEFIVKLNVPNINKKNIPNIKIRLNLLMFTLPTLVENIPIAKVIDETITK